MLATHDLTIRFGGHVAVNAVTCSFEPGTLTAMGLTVGFMTPQQLATREHAYTEAWRRIIKTSGFVPQ